MHPTNNSQRAPFRLLPLVLVTAFCVWGCVPTRYTSNTGASEPLPLGDLTSREIIERLPRFPAALDTLYAEADVAVSSPEEKGRFRARIAYRRADSMLIRVRFPLGIEGARVLVTADSAFVFDRVENILYQGSPEDVSSALPVAVAGTNLIELATGFVAPDDAAGWSVTTDSLRYHLHSPDDRILLVVNPELWRIVRMARKDASGMIVEQRWYMDFRLFNDTLLPQRMALARPTQNTRLTMALRTLDQAPVQLSFELGLRADTERQTIY